ncbi:MAG: hypothetical protein LBV54_00065 [Puniceicoccales bacterium]|nr:hypothetical protein [Puniceicoccales bacterium]
MSTSTSPVAFATTRWTLVFQTGGGDAPAQRALEELCRIYWKPLYAYVRRRGYARADAEDLTQDFFARLLQRHDFAAGLDAGNGCFRAFLLALLKHHLANARDHDSRQKRGGGIPALSLNWADAESLLERIGDTAPAPDAAFDHGWALALLECVLERLREEWECKGKAVLFDVIKVFLTPERADASYADAAHRAGVDEGTLRVAAHRLRRRYRELLKEEIAQTVKDSAMVDEELRALMQAFH